MAQVHHNLAFGIELHVRAIHGPRRRTLEVDAFGVVAAAVARALELVFAGLPVGRAAQVRADGEITKMPSVLRTTQMRYLVLEFGVDAEAEVGRDIRS